jgi:enoyl-CoA hydratase/carnithine racemase
LDERVARITLDNPPRNVMTLEALRELSDVLHEAARGEAVCAISLEAAPGIRTFCSGLAAEAQRPDLAYQLLDALHGFVRNLEFYSKPVVAVVNDAALGVGCELLACADIVIASEKARFGLPQIKIGLLPSLASVYLPRVVGLRKAKEMILTGRLLTAQEALACGLVTYVVPEEQLQVKHAEVLSTFRRLSAPVLETARRAVSEASGLSVVEALERVEDIYLNQLMTLKDPGEGMISVMEKRSPLWRHK